MNRRMMDILACPIDKHFPLELTEISSSKESVEHGALFCLKCSRFYPIIDDIPILLPDDLRDKDMDMRFLKKHESALPEKITKGGQPWHIG